MKDSLTVGLEHEEKVTVDASMTPPHVPTVLSTPKMVQLIEMTCFSGSMPHLDPGETMVGTHICVSHEGPAYVGEVVTVKSRVKEINKRRITYEVEVHAPSGLVSKGTHQRAVVTPKRMVKAE